MSSTSADAAKRPQSIEHVAISVSGETFTLEVAPPRGDLLDHFPGLPIIPAFVQVDWIAWVLLHYFKVGTIRAIEDVKFLAPIFPPCTLKGTVTFESGECSVTVTLPDGKVCAKGIFRT